MTSETSLQLLRRVNLPLLPLAFGNTLSLGESIEFQILGALVVFSALAFLWGALEVVGYFFRRADARAREKRMAPADAERVAPAREASLGISSEVLCVLAAAVHVTFKQRVRIVSVQLRPPTGTISQLALQAWTVEGRRQIFDSRRVR